MLREKLYDDRRGLVLGGVASWQDLRGIMDST